MGKRNFRVDFVQLFAYIVNGEFLEGVHQTPHDPGGLVVADLPDYPISFCLKSFLSVYK